MTAVVTSDGREPRPERLTGGWRVIAAKELRDHLRSVRFALLMVLVSLAGLAAVYSTAGSINSIVGSQPRDSSIFLFLFTGVPSSLRSGTGSDLPSFVTFIGLLGPLLGLVLGFDALSAERSRRTLSRLVSQPIHRDDVITGKFAAGLAAIALATGTLTTMVAGVGVLRLGLIPSAADAVRLLAFWVLSLLYVGVWLGLAILASVQFREASTAALGTLAVWIVLSLFLGLITGAVADRFYRVTADPAKEPDAYSAQVVANTRLDDRLQKLSPLRLYDDASAVVLNPYVNSTSAVVDQAKVDRAIPSPLELTESLVVAWSQLAGLLGITVVVFVAGFVLFMRQEVRA
jgi:ABC-2 type transport system permease protein